MYVIVGLGNPGEEYRKTRHNTGRIVLSSFVKEFCEEPEASPKLRALVSKGKVKKEPVTVVFPETFMNKSGQSVSPLVTSKKKAEKLVVVYDELDLPIGRIKISFDRGSGGHKGVESIARAVKTTAFVRIRVGISPTTASGKIKKPSGGAAVEKHILGNFSPKEIDVLKKVGKEISEALETIVLEGREVAMSQFN